MTDRYRQLVNTPLGRIVSKQIGMPAPVKLERHSPGAPVIDGPVLLGAAPGGRLGAGAAAALAAMGAHSWTASHHGARSPAVETGLDAGVWDPDAAGEDEMFKALLFDASGISSSEQLREAWAFFHPTIRRLRARGRVIVLGTPPADCAAPREATAQRALEGLVRSIAKEVKRGATAQLIQAAPGAEGQIESSLRFFLSPKSAYVSAQVVRVGRAVAACSERVDWERPLGGKVAIVTGAARGIGAVIAEVLARDGAHVVGLDVPALDRELADGLSRLGGSTIALDITAADSPGLIASHLLREHGGVDIVVHNAGVTRDKTLGRMSEEHWNMVIAVNLSSQERIDDELLARKVLRPDGRIVCVSSISGIAGNAGQANYSTSKAGVIGMVQSMAPEVAKQRLTINAVAPGFIETQMTEAMPVGLREAGRRMNSLSQGGLPVDVAETIAWYAQPGSSGVNGNVVRVCGQSLLGA